MSLARLVSPKKEMVRKIKFVAPNAAGTTLVVKMKYVPPQIMEERQNENRIRVMGDRQANPLSDMEAASREMTRLFHMLLATCVVRVDDGPDDDGLSVRKVAQLLPVDDAVVQELGGGSAKLHSNTEDESELDDEQRDALGYGKDVKTAGQAAAQNIVTLMNYDPFRDFVWKAARDVSLFQDSTLEKDLKNS